MLVGAVAHKGGNVLSSRAQRPRRLRAGATLLTAAILASTLAGASATAVTRTESAPTAALPLPLLGLTIALDPGHQLGNYRFPREVSRQVPAGGFRKDCNTTGTETESGVREPTVVWQITKRVRKRLQALGATVRLTRNTNRLDRWGPCVNYRGRFGGRKDAQLTVSVHADGAPSRQHGFHVIAPKKRSPWTTRTARPSLRLAKDLRGGLDGRGFARSTYIGGGSALSIRSDLGTLNLSTVPVAMIEIGNMRNPGDARRMTHRHGQERYAAAIVTGIRHFLHR